MSRLTLCVMARNEEKNIGRALESFRGVADETVIVDTGSSDRTKEITARFGARLFDFEWIDDFSAVRNFMFAQATSEWIFHLDADEALLPESIAELKEVLIRGDVQGAVILRQDIADLKHPDAFTEMWQLRLFRREALPKQIGRCHPHFEPPLEMIAASRGRQVVPTGIRIRHWGYVEEMKQAKLERGARLLQLELAERPGQLYYLSELVRTQLVLRDPAARQTLQEASEILAGHRESPGIAAMGLLETLIMLPPGQQPVGWSARRAAELAMQWFPTSIPLRWQIARTAFIEEDFSLALLQLEAIRDLGRSGNYDRSISFNPALLGAELHLNLGVCYVREAKLDKAEDAFNAIRDDPDYGPMARENLETVARLKREYEPS